MKDISKEQGKILNAQYISLFLINMVVSVGFSMVSTTISVYVSKFGASDAVAGAIVGAMSIAAMTIRPFTGVLCDRFSRKKLLLLALLGSGVAMLGYGLTHSTALLIVLRILHGIFFAIVTTVTMALVADTIPSAKLSQGMGYFAVGQTISIAIAPAIGLAIGNAVGYSFTFFAAAGLIVCAIVIAQFVRFSNADIRIRPPMGREKLSLESFIAKEALLFSMMAIVISGTTGIENGFIVLYGKSLGMANVGWYFTISAVALLFARIVFGKYADRYGLKSVLFPGIGIIAFALLLLRFADASNAAAIFAITAALKALGAGAVQPALQAGCFQATDEKRRGAASCTYFLGADIGQGFAPIFGGMVAGYTGYGNMFAFFTVPLLIAAAFYWFATNRKTKPKGRSVHV